MDNYVMCVCLHAKIKKRVLNVLKFAKHNCINIRALYII